MYRRFVTCLLSLLLLSGAGVGADNSGVTQTVLMRSGADSDGKPFRYPSGKAEISTVIVELAPGAMTPLHRHPGPVVGYVLQGELEVRAAGGIVNHYKSGDAFIESINRAHQGINTGSVPTKLLVTFIGIKGRPVTVPAPTKE